MTINEPVAAVNAVDADCDLRTANPPAAESRSNADPETPLTAPTLGTAPNPPILNTAPNPPILGGLNAVAANAGHDALPRNVRHDLRSNIGQVIGYSELLIDDLANPAVSLDPAAMRRDLERILAAGRKMLELTNEFIDPVGARVRSEMSAMAEIASETRNDNAST